MKGKSKLDQEYQHRKQSIPTNGTQFGYFKDKDNFIILEIDEKGRDDVSLGLQRWVLAAIMLTPILP